ncbi:hypothetical protein CYMTET_35837, partial [Cymbomonas tetramitiformis]
TCLVCGVSVHCGCASKAALDCKRRCSRAKPPCKPKELLMHHHWVDKVQMDLGTDGAYESLLDGTLAAHSPVPPGIHFSRRSMSHPCNDFD